MTAADVSRYALGFLLILLLFLVELQTRRRRSVASRRGRFGAITRDPHDGERVVIEGRLRATASVPRLEDGAPVLASTVRANGKVLAQIQAEGIALERDDGTSFALEGPLEITIGSDERAPGVRVEKLGREVLARIAEAGADARGRRAMFRSLATGDRARVKGVLSSHVEARDLGYRESVERFALTGGLTAAYSAMPRVRGTLGSFLFGPRVRSAPFLFAIVAPLLLGFTAILTFRASAVTSAAPSAKPFVLKREACEELSKSYAGALARATYCDSDEQCVAVTRGKQWFALDDCFRVVRRGAPEIAQADAIAQRWLDGGCASDFETCRLPPPVQCLERNCVERPPAGLPYDWKRKRVARLFSLFTPPGTRVESGGEDSIARSFIHPSFRLWSDYGPWSGLGPEQDGGERTEERVIDGRKALVRRGEKELTVWVGEMPPCPANRCGLLSMGGNRLTFGAECATKDACDTVLRIIDSLETYGEER